MKRATPNPIARLQHDDGHATLPKISCGYQPRETRTNHDDVCHFGHPGLRLRPRSTLEGHPAGEDHVVVRRALAGAHDCPRSRAEAFQLVMGHGADARVREQLAQSGW